jgi:hypothetical protein
VIGWLAGGGAIRDQSDSINESLLLLLTGLKYPAISECLRRAIGAAEAVVIQKASRGRMMMKESGVRSLMMIRMFRYVVLK